jgi:VanZ family protein
MALYAGLASLVGAGLRQKGSGSVAFQALFPIVFAGLYGISDEIHQLFVPNRSFELLDILSDISGAALFQIAYYGIVRRALKSGA